MNGDKIRSNYSIKMLCNGYKKIKKLTRAMERHIGKADNKGRHTNRKRENL